MISNLLWLFFAFVAVRIGVLKYYSDKPLNNWSWQRKLYFSCWLGVALISFVNGLRVFIENPTFNFYAQFALGIQFLLIAVMPCRVKVLNKPWPVRRLRDLFLVGMGIMSISFAFHIA